MARILRSPWTRLLVTVAVASSFTGVALAYFGAPGSGSVPASVGSLSAATISTPASSGMSVTISWLSHATVGEPSLNDAITYRLERKAGAEAYAPIAAGPCSGTLPSGTNSCTDTLSMSGSYSYRAIATFNSWTAASNETSVNATVTVPVATTTTLTSSSNPSTVGEPVTYTATVAAASSQTLTGTVTFKSGTTTIACETNSSAFDGTNATCAVTYAASDGSPQSISATYSGDKNFLGSTSHRVDQVVNDVAPATTTTTVPAKTATSP